jgi:hypothetical protein
MKALAKFGGRALVLSAMLAVILLVFVQSVRPWYLTWGASADEADRSLPGDAVLPAAREQGTRAITISAPAEQVWPWVAQLGQDRGGFYSYEVLEDLVGCEMPSADRIRPEFQGWKPGDKLWMYPPDKWNGLGHGALAAYEPGRAISFATRQIGTSPASPYDGNWTFVVEPIDAKRSRLLVRGREAGSPAWLARTFDHFVFEPIHFVMEKRMMVGIQQLAEGGRLSRARDIAQVLLWTAAFTLFLFSIVLVFRREDWVPHLLLVAASAVVFEFLTLAQPSPAFGAILVGWIAAWLWGPMALSGNSDEEDDLHPALSTLAHTGRTGLAAPPSGGAVH